MEKNNNYKVCLFGASLDVGNQGCRALAVSLIKLILANRPDAHIYLLYGNKYSDIKFIYIAGKKIKVNIINSRLSPKAKLNEHLLWIFLIALLYWLFPNKSLRKLFVKTTPWIRVLEQGDFIGDIRGGDSFSDIYGLPRLVLGSIPCIITILMRKKLILLPQTYGPFQSKISKYIARYILKNSKIIYTRDRNSITVVKETLGKYEKDKIIRFCPDVAFTLDAVTPEVIDIQPPVDIDMTSTLIGLNISGLLYNGGYSRDNMFKLKFDYKDFIYALILRLMKETDDHILLVPHVFGEGVESDFNACLEIYESTEKLYQNRLHRVMREYDQNEIKGIIGLCDFFIGSRMHSCIAALSQGIPCVGIAYSKKFWGVFESIGMENNCIDGRKLGKEEA
ncbi:polysaccharide pyruvyl transferase family protein, partial [Candidatus Latescibacterota bacterium]